MGWNAFFMYSINNLSLYEMYAVVILYKAFSLNIQKMYIR